jgi:hypothetical protein
MRYFFLAFGALAASVFWVQSSSDKEDIKRQLAEVPSYSIMPD